MTLAESEIKKKLKQYEPAEMWFDSSILSDREVKVLMKMIEASKCIDEIFWSQSYRGSIDLRKRLERSQSPSDRDLLHYLKINYGPFDRIHEFHPFIGDQPKPAGAALYPEDLSKEEFGNYVRAHPDEKAALESPTTVIRRDGDRLLAVPYHTEYRQYLEPAAAALREAAEYAESESLQKYLLSRAEALLSDDFFQSDCDWIDLDDPTFDFVIGPYEVYEDKLLGLKTTYEGVVMIKDHEASQALDVYVARLRDLEKNLPIPEAWKQLDRTLTSPMSVVEDIYRGGDIRAGYQAVAFVLPNDPKVREAKGSKKIFHRNFLDARVNKVIKPLAQELLAPDQAPLVTDEGYFNFVVMHELSHVLGPNYTVARPEKVEIYKALGSHYTGIEEGKADVVGLHSLNFFIDQGVIDPQREREHYVSYLGGLFRTIRFGADEAHGRAGLFEFAFLRDEGAIHYDPVTDRFSINFSTFRNAVQKLARLFLTIEAEGDAVKAEETLIKYGKFSPELKSAVDRCAHVPVEFEPLFLVN